MADDVGSLYPRPPVQQPSLASNPLALIDVIGKLNQNALFQKEFAAKKAIGEAYHRSLKSDGTLDTETLAQGLKHPDAAFGLSQAVTGMLQQQQEQLALKAKQNDFIMNWVGSARDDPNLNKNTLRNWALIGARNLKIPPEMVDQILSQIPDNASPDKVREAVTTIGDMVMGAAGISKPAVETVDPVTLEKRTISQGQFNRGVGAIGAPPIPRLPGAPASQPKPPGVQTGLRPGVGEAAAVTGQSSGALLASSRENSIAFPRQVFPLEQAISSLERLGPQGSGPGADTVNHIKSFAMTMGLPGVDAKKIVDFDTAKKYLTDFVNQTGNSGTNEKLQAAFAGNPSVHIANESAIKVSKAALALRRADEARMKAFEDSGLPETDFAKFAGKWNRDHDVRVYGMDLMTAAQRKAVLQELPQSKRDLFMLDVDQAEQLGVIRPPRLLPPPTKK